MFADMGTVAVNVRLSAALRCMAPVSATLAASVRYLVTLRANEAFSGAAADRLRVRLETFVSTGASPSEALNTRLIAVSRDKVGAMVNVTVRLRPRVVTSAAEATRPALAVNVLLCASPLVSVADNGRVAFNVRPRADC